MARVIVFANHKGGCCKTTSTANLGACLARLGNRVLIVDSDGQANLGEEFGWHEGRAGERLEDLLENPAATADFTPPVALGESFAEQLDWRERLRIIPCTSQISSVADELPQNAGESYHLRFREVIDAYRDDFDFIVIDTPPGLGILPGMALLAADEVIIPARPSDHDIGGAGKIYDTIEQELPQLGHQPQILGILLTQIDRRWRIGHQAREALERDGMRLLSIEIPVMVRVAETPRFGAPICVLEPGSRVSWRYRKLAELIQDESPDLARGGAEVAA